MHQAKRLAKAKRSMGSAALRVVQCRVARHLRQAARNTPTFGGCHEAAAEAVPPKIGLDEPAFQIGDARRD